MSLPRDERDLDTEGYPARVRIDTNTQLLEVSWDDEGDNWFFHPRFWTMGYFGVVLAEPGWDDSQMMTIGEVYAD